MIVHLAWFIDGLKYLRKVTDHVVIIDALRCSATIVTALEHSVRSIIPVERVKDGLMLKKRFSRALLSAEVDAVKVPDADVGNSPTKIREILSRKRYDVMIIRTSAGTRAIKKALSLGFKTVVIGTFLNARAVAKYLANRAPSVGILCAGYKGKYFAIEDFLAAGAIVGELFSLLDHLNPEDQALASHLAFKSAKDNLIDVILMGRSARRLAEIGEEYDIQESIRMNVSEVVPVAFKNEIRDASALI